MKIYYDTEFLEDGETIELISIGMVAEDGRELYAINADMPFKRVIADEWLRKHVVPSLPTTEPRQYRDGLPPHGELDHSHPDVRPRYQIWRMVREFIRATPDVDLWAWYGAYDHVVLCQLWGRMVDLPDGVPMYTHDLQQEVDRLGNPPMPQQIEGLHNALADARHVKAMDEHLASIKPEFSLDELPDECTACGRDEEDAGPMYLDPRPRHPSEPQAVFCRDCAADKFDIGEEGPDA